MTFTWQNGRQLASLQTANNKLNYKYDSNGQVYSMSKGENSLTIFIGELSKVKSIIFMISAFVFFSGGVWLFESIEERIPDDNWIIVVCKILAALIGLVIYIAIFRKLAGVFGITWHYPDV